MAGQTERRILECVPPVLSKEKQFELLSFQIFSVLQQQKSALKASCSRTSKVGATDPFSDLTRIFSKASGIKTSELESMYKSLAAIVVKQEYKLDWFVNKSFPPTEVKEFINVFKFTMLDCLRQSYAQVRNDLMLMHEYLPGLDGSVDLSYKIALLDCHVELDTYPPPGASQLAITMSEPTLVTQFRDQYRTILLDHAVAQCKADIIIHANRQVAMADVENVVTQLQRTESDQEYDTTLEVEGHGGVLNIRLQKKNLLRLRYAIVQQTLLLLLVLAVIGGVVVWFCIKGLWPVLLFFIYGAACIIKFFWEKLHKLQLEVKEYERKRATRFTAS